MIILLGWELVLSIGAYDHPIPPYHMILAYVLSSPRHLFNTCVSSASSCERYHMLENGTYNEDDVASIRNRSIRSVLECPGRILQHPITSLHFLLIVMTTDSMVFHWIWTGINVDNQLWVILDPLFFSWPMLFLLWLHTVVWLLLLPAPGHCMISSSHGNAWTRENGTHQYRSFLHPHTMGFIRITHQNRYSPSVTFNIIRSVNIITMKQDLWILRDWLISNQQENDLFAINLSKKYNL